MEEHITKLLEAIDAIVNVNAPYKEKRDKVLAVVNEQENSNFQEFIAWFPEEDEDKDNVA